MHNHNKLDVWRRSYALAREVYGVAGAFPDHERFGLASQLRRASVSIPSNIAEGCSETSDNAFARFLRVALGSTFELETQLRLVADLGYLKTGRAEPPMGETVEIKKMLVALVRSRSPETA